MARPPERPRAPAAAPRQGGRAHAYYELTKPTIALYVVIVAAAAWYLAQGSAGLSLGPLAVLAAGLLVATGGVLALNQYLERAPDALMRRTRSRPLPSGRVAPGAALAFALLLIATGTAVLWVGLGWLPAVLTLTAGTAYNFVYTPLKPRTYVATLVGAFPGAVPALVGWSAATGSLSPGAWVLFGIAYFWQMPHVLGLAWVLREDYRAAGFLLTPPADPGGKVIGLHMVAHAAILLPVSLLPSLFGLTGSLYAVGALGLGIWLIWLCVRAWRGMSTARARSVFLGSLLYQPLLLGLMLLDVAALGR
ncbi:MAG: heme o synthase [Gemmatimonadota bacterium]|nr:heme o synthase [Gemmatimonadota bacterium]